MKVVLTTSEARKQERRIKNWATKVKYKLLVMSGKGGVGKSTVTANLAFALAWKGYRVAILDADIHGSSIPKMLGLHGQRLKVGPSGIFSAVSPLGVRVVSMDFLLPTDDTPVIWRGPVKMGLIRQFLADVSWGDVDFLLVDLPPGTGDEPQSVVQLIPDISGAILVTIPSEVSQIVVKKAITFARKLNLPIVGIIENMSGFICPKCGAETDIFKLGGGEQIAKELKTPFLGRIPLDSRICEDSDRGTPFVIRQDNSPAVKAFMSIVENVEKFLRGSQG